MSDDALFPVGEARHAMWTPPLPGERLTAHTRSLRKEIARELKRFDGRKDLHVPIAFCESVYDVSDNEIIRLLGLIAWAKAMSHRALSKEPITPPDRRDINIITLLAERFVEAVTKEIA